MSLPLPHSQLAVCPRQGVHAGPPQGISHAMAPGGSNPGPGLSLWGCGCGGRGLTLTPGLAGLLSSSGLDLSSPTWRLTCRDGTSSPWSSASSVWRLALSLSLGWPQAACRFSHKLSAGPSLQRPWCLLGSQPRNPRARTLSSPLLSLAAGLSVSLGVEEGQSSVALLTSGKEYKSSGAPPDAGSRW